jgi:hypothetical protein
MISFLITVYRAWPLRPHCSDSRHVALCRWLGLSGTRCPAKDA